MDAYLTSHRGGVVCGVESAESGGLSIINHIKRTLPASAFMAVGRLSRARRFFADLPQIEELEEDETAKLRCIAGEEARLDLALAISPALPIWTVTLCDPVTRVLDGFSVQAKRAMAVSGNILTLDQYLSWPQETNPVSRAILRQIGDLEPDDADPDVDLVVSLLKRARFVFLRDHLKAQSRGLFIEMGLPVGLKDAPPRFDPAAMEVTPAQLKTITSRHAVDQKLYDAARLCSTADRVYGGPVNPFGYEEALLRRDVAMAQAYAVDPTAILEQAYQDLIDQIAGDMLLEALLLKLEHGALDHVEDRDLFLGMLLRAGFENDWSNKERAKSKVNAGLFAMGRLNRPDLGRRYADEALTLAPGFHPAQKLLDQIARQQEIPVAPLTETA